MAEDTQRTEHDENEEELGDQNAELLPDREAMSLITPTTPIDLPAGSLPIESPGHTLPVEPNDPT
jgi:hypothetical protein